MKSYDTATLPCGLRVIHETASSNVVYCGFVVCAGTRDEEEADSGMAHFIEHLTFKGTSRRRACHITNGLERVGGELNAFTTKQETVYYATVLKEDFPRAADLLADIVFHSTYPQAEIEKEVEVICDEIESYKDSPADIIFDEFEQLMYPGQPLGRDILGCAERLRQYVTADARRFADRYYRPDNAVFYCYGDVPFARVVRLLEKLLPASDFARQSPLRLSSAAPQPVEGPVRREVEKGTHQAHVVVGCPTFGGRDPERFPLTLLSNLLGGPGMNSRFNVRLREKAGLVYSVEAYMNTYIDTGFWNVYFGCDAHDVPRCLRLLESELSRVAESPLTPSQLAAAKKQLRGQVGIARNAAESYALAMGKTFAHYNRHRDVDEICRRLDAVTAEQVQAVASHLLVPGRMVTLIYR